MPSWSPSRSGCAPPYVRATPWPGSAGTSSSYLAEGVSEGVDQGALAARVQDVLDAAMDRAKARGRGRYELSHESPVGVLGRT